MSKRLADKIISRECSTEAWRLAKNYFEFEEQAVKLAKVAIEYRNQIAWECGSNEAQDVALSKVLHELGIKVNRSDCDRWEIDDDS